MSQIFDGLTIKTIYPVAAPTITRSPASLTLSVNQGSNVSNQTFTVGNGGAAALNYTITKTQPWIASVTPASGTVGVGGANSTITVTFNTTGLAAGPYSDTITITDANATNNPMTIAVGLTVVTPGTPTLVSISPTSGTQGTVQGLTITGANTTWSGNMLSSIHISGSGVTATNASATSPTSIGANISIASNADLGAHTVTVDGATGSATFTVNTPTTAPTITQLEKTGTVGVAITSANVGDGISIVGTNFGFPQGTSTVTVNGVASTVYYWSGTKIDLAVPNTTSGNVVVTIGGVASNGLPLTIGNLPASLSITTTSLPGATVGTAYNQPLQAINGTTPYTWTITVGTLPTGLALSTAGVISGTPTTVQTANFTVQVADSATHTATQALAITVTTGGTPTAIVIDDFEGTCVGDWQAPNLNSGYYTFQDGMITPNNDNITASGPDASAFKNGAKGMKVRFSYVKNADVNKDWGDGWGAALIKTLDLSAMKSVTMNINWDGSTNAIKFGFKDSAGHVTVATVTNSKLMTLGGYSQLSIPVADFSEDTTDPTRTAGAIDWTRVTNYNFAYINKGTTTNYQSIDDITAQLGNVPPVPPSGDAPVIISIAPTAAPAGRNIAVTGLRFGNAQGQSVLLFNNKTTNVSYQATIRSWSDTALNAVVPQTAIIGTYEVVVNRVAIISGVVNALQSNPTGFQVTAAGAGDIAVIYPNPFNPNSQPVNIIVTDPAGATNIGCYIFDMTARLVNKQVLTGTNQTTWNGLDQDGMTVADGAYILRAINEDTKTLLAKGKILVIKR